MATRASTDANRDAPLRSFYLPAVPSLSGEPGAVERLLIEVYARNRRFLRRME